MTSASKAKQSAPSSPRRRARQGGCREISVAIHTYRRAPQFYPPLENLSDQTVDSDRFEVVVVDDCWTDDTSEVGKALARTFRQEVGDEVTA